MKLIKLPFVKKLMVAVLFLGSVSVYAQLNVSAEIRPRFEYRNGFKTLRPVDNYNPAAFVEQRTRLYVTFKKDRLKVHMALQDVRLWGNHNQIYKTDNLNMFNIYEGYGVYQFANKWDFKVGRQALDYDNARFFGDLRWAQQGRSHDAFLFRYKTKEGFTGNVGIALNNSGTEPTLLADPVYLMKNYKNMQFLYLQKKWEKAKASLIVQNDGVQKRDSATVADGTIAIYYSQTLGLTGGGDIGEHFAWAAEFFYQMGKTTTNTDISAYMYSASLTYKTKLTPITVGIDNLSGTAQGSDNNNAFNPKYGTNHKFYGFMDYFYVGNGHGQQGRGTGLTDVFLKTNFKLAEKHNLVAHLHYFMSPVTVYAPSDMTKELGNGLGTEIDLVYIYKIAPAVTLNVGYSQMLATESMEAIKGFNDGRYNNATNNWGWVMLTFKPEIYASKTKVPAN